MPGCSVGEGMMDTPIDQQPVGAPDYLLYIGGYIAYPSIQGL